MAFRQKINTIAEVNVNQPIMTRFHPAEKDVTVGGDLIDDSPFQKILAAGFCSNRVHPVVKSMEDERIKSFLH